MKVKEYRERLGITQEYMAKRLNITQQAYSRKENGERGFKAVELLLLEDILGATFSELFGDLLKKDRG